MAYQRQEKVYCLTGRKSRGCTKQNIYEFPMAFLKSAKCIENMVKILRGLPYLDTKDKKI